MRFFIGVGALALATSPAIAQTPVSGAPSQPLSPSSGTLSQPGFATDGISQPDEGRDRFEKLNRGVWGFNQTVDRFVLKPASTVYRTVTPVPARRGISRVFANLSEPWSFINNLLQGKPGRAFNNLGRFIINTTIGVGGLADHASELGLKDTPEDFGQTLAVWGVKHSAYVVLPVLGPSTVRDGVGTGVAFFADPYQICLNDCVDLSRWTKRGITALSVVSTRSDLTDDGADAFLQSSLDPYATARSAFLQRREAAIANLDDADAGDATSPPDVSVDPTMSPAPPAPAKDVPRP